MRTPSERALRELFGDRSKHAKTVLRMSRRGLEVTEGGAARIAECYHPPATYDLRMSELNRLAGTYGVESCETERGEYAEYLNTGDTYTPTLIRWRGNYRMQSIGDFIETMERQGVHFK